jgi:SET domain-containing protein
VWQRSGIHGAGLFATRRIAAQELIIEYTGLLIRPVLEDVLERRYEAQGQDSSYLFRCAAAWGACSMGFCWLEQGSVDSSTAVVE